MNSKLYANKYKIPQNILDYIQKNIMNNPNNDGIRRAKFLIKNGEVTYQSLKRLKNYFRHYNANNDNNVQYELAGGTMMKNFVDRVLNVERDAVDRSDKLKQDSNVNLRLSVRPFKVTPNLDETNSKGHKDNVVIVIKNNDGKYLLLKRGIDTTWMPNKWGFVGGSIENNESINDAAEREVKEETGLNVKLIDDPILVKWNKVINHYFNHSYDGDDNNVMLNSENSKYGWFTKSEISFLDTTPNIIRYIEMF